MISKAITGYINAVFSHILGNSFMFCSNDLSYDVASGSEISLVVYKFTGNVMTSITTLRT